MLLTNALDRRRLLLGFAVTGIILGPLGELTTAQIPRTAIPLRRDRLVVSSEKAFKALRVFDLRTGEEIFSANIGADLGDGRAMAVDAHGHIVIIKDFDTVIWYDRELRRMREMKLDLGCIGNPPGSGVVAIVFGPRGTMFLAARYQSCALNYLFEIDPQTGSCLNATTLPFCPTDMTLGPDGLLYLTPAPRTGLVYAYDLTLAPLAPIPEPTVGSPILWGLGDIRVTPGGSIVLGDVENGDLWISDPSQTTWSLLHGCGNTGAYASFAVGHGSAFAVQSLCSLGSGWISQIDLNTGVILKHIDATAQASISHLALLDH